MRDTTYNNLYYGIDSIYRENHTLLHNSVIGIVFSLHRVQIIYLPTIDFYHINFVNFVHFTNFSNLIVRWNMYALHLVLIDLFWFFSRLIRSSCWKFIELCWYPMHTWNVHNLWIRVGGFIFRANFRKKNSEQVRCRRNFQVDVHFVSLSCCEIENIYFRLYL